MIEVTALTVGYTRPILEGIDLQIQSGSFWGIIGANGIGKSTFLKTISGILPPLDGHIVLDGDLLAKIDIRNRSLKMALVSPERFDAGNFSVFEIAAFGRYPHLGYLGKLGQTDHRIIETYLDLFKLIPLRNRRFKEISQGEAQRCLIARALIQETPYLFLDEPLSHLDLHHQIDVLGLLRRKTTQENKSVVMISHEIKLTCLMADNLMIIGRDGRITTGKTECLMAAGALEKAFEWSAGFFDYPSYSLEIFPESAAGTRLNQWVLIRGDDPGLILVARFLLKNGILPRIEADSRSYLGHWAQSVGLSSNPECASVLPNTKMPGDRSATEGIVGLTDQPIGIVLEKGIPDGLGDAYRNVPIMEYEGNALTLIRQIEIQILPKP